MLAAFFWLATVPDLSIHLKTNINNVGLMRCCSPDIPCEILPPSRLSLLEELERLSFNRTSFSSYQSLFMSSNPLHGCSKWISFSAVLMAATPATQWRLTANQPWTSWLMLDQLKRLLMIHVSQAYWDESYLIESVFAVLLSSILDSPEQKNFIFGCL